MSATIYFQILSDTKLKVRHHWVTKPERSAAVFVVVFLAPEAEAETYARAILVTGNSSTDY